MALADTTIEDQLRGEIKRLHKLLRLARRALPVAADLPSKGVNRVDYTDKEWGEITKLSRLLDKELGRRA